MNAFISSKLPKAEMIKVGAYRKNSKNGKKNLKKRFFCGKNVFQGLMKTLRNCETKIKNENCSK